MNARKSFPVFLSFGRMALHLTDEQAGLLFKAVIQYVESRKEPDFKNDPMLAMVFENFREVEDDNLSKWIATREKRSKAGLASAEARTKKKNEEPDRFITMEEIDEIEDELPFS